MAHAIHGDARCDDIIYPVRSCSTNKLGRDNDAEKSHLLL
jgi:hypothetical protein